MAEIKINMDALKARREYKRHKIQDGDNIFRILPPFGKPEEHNGWPYKKWTVIWGLTDPSTGKITPVASPSMSGDKQCPVYQYVDLLEARAVQMSAELTTKGVDPAAIKEEMKLIYDVIKNIKPRSVYAYNACSKGGEIGILEVKTTAHKGIQKEMMQYIRDYNQDPTSLNSEDDDSGVWFKINRTGQNFDTVYSVTKSSTMTKLPNGQKAYLDDRSALSDNVVNSFHDSGYDLNSLYRKKSYDEVKALLMFNIGNMTEQGNTNLELVVPGFDKFGPTGATTSGEKFPKLAKMLRDNATANQPVVATGKKPIVLKVDEEVEDDGVPPWNTTDKAIFEMADGILDD